MRSPKQFIMQTIGIQKLQAVTDSKGGPWSNFEKHNDLSEQSPAVRSVRLLSWNVKLIRVNPDDIAWMEEQQVL